MSTQFWDRLWRSAGIQFVVFFLIAYLIYGDQPSVGIAWIVVISGILLKSPSATRAPDHAVVPQW